MLDGIIDKVGEDLCEPITITDHGRQIGYQDIKLDFSRGGSYTKPLDHIRENSNEVHPITSELNLSGVDPGQIQ